MPRPSNRVRMQRGASKILGRQTSPLASKPGDFAQREGEAGTQRSRGLCFRNPLMQRPTRPTRPMRTKPIKPKMPPLRALETRVRPTRPSRRLGGACEASLSTERRNSRHFHYCMSTSSSSSSSDGVSVCIMLGSWREEDDLASSRVAMRGTRLQRRMCTARTALH